MQDYSPQGLESPWKVSHFFDTFRGDGEFLTTNELLSEASRARERAMSMNPAGAGLQQAVASAIHEHWKLFLIEGIILGLLGVAAIAVPWIATLAFTLVLGWLFLISGIVGLVTTFWMRGAPGFWWSLFSAIVAIAAGLILLTSPVSGALSLTFVLIAFFVIEGIVTIMYAFEHRNQLSGRWGWMLASGIVDLILAGIIFAGLPGTAAWALGLLVGINLVFGGTAMVGMALAAKEAA